MAIWKPNLDPSRGAIYLQIVEALADDIRSGALLPGTKLPPYRELGFQLGVSASTTNRAYTEAINRALIHGEVGRGTFVREMPAAETTHWRDELSRPNDGPVDLSRNLPSPAMSGQSLAKTLRAISGESDLSRFTDYEMELDQSFRDEAAISWLGKAGLNATSNEITTTAGARHGLFCALMAVCQPGDLLLVEELSYAPVRAMAEKLALKVKAVSIDQDGLEPDALEAVCRSSAARALYVTPTLQTPTTSTMPLERRHAIAALAKAQELVVIEDDVFGLLLPSVPTPLAHMLPEHSVYLTSTSKYLAPGFRVGFARANERLTRAIRHAVDLSNWMLPSLMVEIAARWIKDGTADSLIASQRSHARARQDLAATILKEHAFEANRNGLHLWMELPPEIHSTSVVAEMERRGVLGLSDVSFRMAPNVTANAIRLCLSHEPEEDRIRSGLEQVADILDQWPTLPRQFV